MTIAVLLNFYLLKTKKEMAARGAFFLLPEKPFSQIHLPVLVLRESITTASQPAQPALFNRLFRILPTARYGSRSLHLILIYPDALLQTVYDTNPLPEKK